MLARAQGFEHQPIAAGKAVPVTCVCGIAAGPPAINGRRCEKEVRCRRIVAEQIAQRLSIDADFEGCRRMNEAVG